MKSIQTNTVIIGAGAAGLAVGACLRRKRVPLVILEKEVGAGSAWVQRYDRLHLHTHKHFSSLPYLSFPRHYPAYPTRLQVAEYLETYAQAFQLGPYYEQTVSHATCDDGLWVTTTDAAKYISRNLVVATGYSAKPRIPTWPGQATFPGPITHSSIYGNGEAFTGQSVLVVGFGNSAGEIAVDLCEHGADVTMAVRSPVNVVPRDLYGLSTHAISVMMSRLPVEIADALSGGLRRMVVGDLTSYGLEHASRGPMAQIKYEDQVPLLDSGTVALIKEGAIRIAKGIDHFDGATVVFANEEASAFDAIILATGFTSSLADFLDGAEAITDEAGRLVTDPEEAGMPGLYFCGFYNAPAGLLRQVGLEAKRIARKIHRRPKSIPTPISISMV